MNNVYGAHRAALLALLAPGTCPGCLEPLASRLHHELCVAGTPQEAA